ncbi:MAG: hypothetical protein IK115_11020 [Lachnospiraceae bacterium]|nr:hypothetical protein [Lachnospiraceae bacterium]
MSKRAKKKKAPVFLIIMLLYIIIGVVVSIVVWKVFESWLADYEASQPKYGMDEVLASMTDEGLDSLIREDTLATEMTNVPVADYRAILKQRLVGKEITVRESKEATKEVPKYQLLADGEPVMDVSLKVVGKNSHDMNMWGYDKFYPDAYNSNDTLYTVTVPGDAVVTVNDRALTESDIKKDADGNAMISQIGDLEVVAEYLDSRPYYVTYEVGGFLIEPTISARYADGSELPLTREENSWSGELQYYADPAAEVEAMVPDLMEAYGKHFIGKGGNVMKYLLPDSQLKADVQSVMTGFYPTEKISSFNFDNKKSYDYVTYSEDCVSCHIYFDLIVSFNSAAYKTKNEGSDATWLFLKKDGTWYLASVLRQKNLEYNGD